MKIVIAAALVLAKCLPTGTVSASPLGHSKKNRQTFEDSKPVHSKNKTKVMTTSSMVQTQYQQFRPTINGKVQNEIPDGNGGWFISGDFTQIGGITRNHIAHIHADGSIDQNWNVALNNSVESMIFDGTYIYIGGAFTTVNNNPSFAYLCRLNATTGIIDLQWNVTPNEAVTQIGISGKDIYVAGKFEKIGQTKRFRLAKLNLIDGSVDEDWDWNSNGYRFTISAQSDGKFAIVELISWM
ncbi:MAG: delta-60 repeat domain-containing protein [Ferruginibacter sp.]